MWFKQFLKRALHILIIQRLPVSVHSTLHNYNEVYHNAFQFTIKLPLCCCNADIRKGIWRCYQQHSGIQGHSEWKRQRSFGAVLFRKWGPFSKMTKYGVKGWELDKFRPTWTHFLQEFCNILMKCYQKVHFNSIQFNNLFTIILKTTKPF